MVAAIALWALLASPPSPLEQIATKYKLRVEVPASAFKWLGDGYQVTADATNDPDLAKYVTLFYKEWNLYPPSFVQRASVSKIVICKGLAVNGQIRAACPAFDGDTMYYDTTLGAYNPRYQRAVIHHEFFHMVDQRARLLYVDPEWQALNSSDFHYGSGGAAMRGSGVGALTDKIPGFLTRYGTAAIEEDKAELFSHMIVDPEFVQKRAAADPVVAAKIRLLKRRLVQFDKNMGESFWRTIPGWGSQD